MSMDVTILIPMAGEGSRFRDVGFLKPKPVIDVAGIPMIIWVVENILPKTHDIRAEIVVVLRRELALASGIVEQLREAAPCVTVVYADEPTEGAACTCLLAREHLSGSRAHNPLLIINSDQVIEWNDDMDSADFWRQLEEEKKQGYDANILCFKNPMELGDSKWSYAATDQDGLVCDVREKEVISDNATVGAYFWHRGADFVSAADEMIRRDIRVNGEFYVAPVYNINVERGHRIKLSFCRRMWGLGVPADLVKFLSRHVRASRISTLGALFGCTSQDLEAHFHMLSPVVRHADGDAVDTDEALRTQRRACRADDTNLGARLDRHHGRTGPHAEDPSEAAARRRGGAHMLSVMRNLERVRFVAAENDPVMIGRAVSEGLEVQADVWYCSAASVEPAGSASQPHPDTESPLAGGQYYLGRDEPVHRIPLSFLEMHADSLWLRARTPETLRQLASLPKLQSFAQSSDEDVVMTSRKILWAPVQRAADALEGSVAVLRGVEAAAECARLLGQPLLAICCSDVRGLRAVRDRQLLAAQVWRRRHKRWWRRRRRRRRGRK